MSDVRRLATLVAFVSVAREHGQDDALEHFDRLHGELQLRVAAQGKRERLRDGQQIDRAGLTLAEACAMLLRPRRRRAGAADRPTICDVFRHGKELESVVAAEVRGGCGSGPVLTGAERDRVEPGGERKRECSGSGGSGRNAGRARHRRDAGADVGGRDALVDAIDGRGERALAERGLGDLAGG